MKKLARLSKINVLTREFNTHARCGELEFFTYMEKCHSRALEALNEFGLFRIRSCVFSDQCISGVPSFRTFLHYVSSNASSPSNYQNLAFLSHSEIISNEIDYGAESWTILGVVLSFKQGKVEFLIYITHKPELPWPQGTMMLTNSPNI